MATTSDLIERSGDLKRRLLDYATGRRFRRAYEEAITERFGATGPRSDADLIDFLDAFVLEHRLADGRTLVEHFVASHPDLPAEEREMLLGWQDVVEGLFAVKGRADDALLLENLVDELTYRVRSNVGPAVFAQMPVGSFLYARLVPLGGDWLLSGRQRVYGADQRATVYRVAAELALKAPRLVFRNPELLAEGWRLQRVERADFIAFFGADLVIVPGSELQERMRAYMRYLTNERRDADGRTAAERAQAAYGKVPEPPEMPLPADLVASETVGVIYDEIDGLNFFPDFGLVAETFEHPELAAEPDHAEAVLAYLESPGIIPLPLRRLAERNPEHANRVFRQVLHRPRFSWERDGERLLRRYKPEYYAKPVLPGVSPVSHRLAQAQLDAQNPARGGGRKRPVSVRKRKRAHAVRRPTAGGRLTGGTAWRAADAGSSTRTAAASASRRR